MARELGEHGVVHEERRVAGRGGPWG
jgi:hypothetical protein